MEGRQTLFPPLFIRTIPTSSTTTTSQPIIVRADDTSEIEFLGGSGDDSTKPTNASVTGFQGEGWTIALVVLTSVRLLVLLTLWIYLTRRTLRSKVSLHRVWVSQLLLAAIALSHLVLYAFVVNPNPVSCGIIRIGLGMAHATPFAILVLKIVLIVSCNKGYDIPWMYQVLLLTSFVGIQLALSIQWTALVPPTETLRERPPGSRTCGVGIINWLWHLTYVMLLMIVGTVASVAAHHIKANHREAMFIAFATGFNIPVWIVWATTAVLLKGKPGTEEQCLAFGLLTTTTLIFFIMFLPRSRQMVALGEGGLYTEDSPAVKPISELTVHKLYYPVYPDQRSSLSARTMAPPSVTDPNGRKDDDDDDDDAMDVYHCDDITTSVPRLNNHWYPPLRDTLGPSASRSKLSSLQSSRSPHRQSSSTPSPSDGHRVRVNTRGPVTHFGTIRSSHGRCLTPPSEEGSTTPSVQESERASNDDSDLEVADFRERNVDGVSYSQVIRQQPMY